MFLLTKEPVSGHKKSRNKSQEAHILISSESIPDALKWCKIGHCNNNKTTNIYNVIKNLVLETFTNGDHICVKR